MTTGQKVMRSNPVDPRRARCERCAAAVLKVYVGGRWVEIDRQEGASEGELVVAVGSLGEARLLRLPSQLQRSGEALHRPHDLTCGAFSG